MRALETRYGRDGARSTRCAPRRRRCASVSRRATSRAVTVDEAIDAIEIGAEARLRAAMRPSLVRVINATGVIVHTNLGRAPLSEAALARVQRGRRRLHQPRIRRRRAARAAAATSHAEKLIARLTGAEAAVVVNNNAAATMLLLAALAAGREVIISRGELVEIGGGFRVPDVMAQSGAVLREVGTTNRTRVDDYAAAISDRTALILRVHPSNFKVVGFTERPALEELVALGRRFNDAGRRGSRQRLARMARRATQLPDGAARRTDRLRERRRRRRRRLLQRRQAARRTAGRHHRGTRATRSIGSGVIR